MIDLLVLQFFAWWFTASLIGGAGFALYGVIWIARKVIQ